VGWVLKDLGERPKNVPRPWGGWHGSMGVKRSRLSCLASKRVSRKTPEILLLEKSSPSRAFIAIACGARPGRPCPAQQPSPVSVCVCVMEPRLTRKARQRATTHAMRQLVLHACVRRSGPCWRVNDMIDQLCFTGI